MESPTYLSKTHNSYFIKGDPSGYPVDLELLHDAYPSVIFVVTNVDEELPYPNVFSRQHVIKALQIDRSLTIPCPECGHRNRYNEGRCDHCEAQVSGSHTAMAVLGTDYQRAMVSLIADEMMQPVVDEYRKGFTSYNTNAIQALGRKDDLLLLLAMGYRPVTL